MHKQRDKFEAIAATAQPAVCILANATATDWMLIGMDGLPLDGESVRDLNRRGLVFAGILGMVEGAPKLALDRIIPDAIVDSMSQLFFGYFVRRFLDAQLAPAPAPAPTAPDVQDDSETWLWRLWALKETRMDS